MGHRLALASRGITIRLAVEGAEHPDTAAITIALRCMVSRERNTFVEDLGVTLADLRALEAGVVAFADMPSR